MNIIQSIDRYINSRMYHYALLINGGWGTGKTFFVKEILIPHINKLKMDVHYISLYGIQSADDISQMLLAQTISKKIPASETKKGQIATNFLSVLFKGGMNYLGFEKEEIVSLVKDIPNYDKSVFIFDDLERCACSINEVLGYINNYVEHSDVSVIIIANEEEIGKWQLDRNPELQTLIAMDPRIKIELPLTAEDRIKGVTEDVKAKATTFTPDEVEYRRQAIFHSNEEYRAVKEKVIGLTIDYTPDLSYIFQTLIKKNITYPPLKDELLNEVDWFVLSSEKDRHTNLRTFQYYLEKITIIFQIIQTNYPSLHQLIIRYTFRSAIRYMKGLELPKWDGDYGAQSFGDSPFSLDQEFGFRFIDDLLLTNDINKMSVNSILTRYDKIVRKKGLLDDDPYQLINHWWESEDEQVSTWLDEISNNVRDGKYSTELYTELIRYLAEIKAHHVMEDKCDQIFNEMLSYVKTADPADLENLERERFILDGKTKKYFTSMIKQINGLIETAKTKSEKQKYVDAIQDEEKWGTNLVALTSMCFKGHSFVYWLDPELILEKIVMSRNSELYQFRCALRDIYDTRVYYEKMQDDYDHLKKLQDGVEKLDTQDWGDIKKAYKVWIKNDIRRYLEKISPTM